jgi:zinc finger CCCH domain-containing protein 13
MEAITNGPGSTPAVTNLAEDVGKLTLQDATDTQQNKDGQQFHDSEGPLYIYSIRQCLYLSKSPLVKAPDGMPLLKDWFGYASVSCNLFRTLPR